MGVYIKGMEMPTTCGKCRIKNAIECDRWKLVRSVVLDRHRDCPLIELPPHGRLIDADALRQTMYHEAFETDSPMQKWDSGCWIRYKMFERMEETAPTVIPASEEGE